MEVVQHCPIILGSPALIAQVIPYAKQLQWVQSTFAGIHPLCVPGLQTDYTLTGIKGILGPLMSEYVFAYVLALERHLIEIREQQTDAVWRNIPYRSLRGITIGICGLGSIGTHIARTARHFGMRVLGYKNTPGSNPDVEQVYTHDSLREFLEQLDYLVITLPNTPQTKHLFDEEALRYMKPECVLMNVGRGQVIVEDALLKALQENRLRGAVLDVFQKEPLPPDNPLWKLPNVFITPHIAATSFPRDIVPVFADNYRRFIDKQPLESVVDFERGY
jgi:phosphoglycerate dehydrogenase-like enzyme